MNITSGIVSRPVKGCVYGVEGIGKSTFASKWPDPLFFDLDGGTSRLDVKRVTDIRSWPQLMDSIQEVWRDSSICRTLVIDTADAAERLCIEYVCGKYGKKGIEDFGYGAGYTYLAEEFARGLNELATCVERGVNVCILAHAVLKTITLPDEMGQYDHWELKLSTKTTNKVAPLVKEWADLLLFANYETYLVLDEKSQKQKAQGGKRMMWASHTTFADAKNRFGLPEKMPFDYSYIAKCVPGDEAVQEIPDTALAPAKPAPKLAPRKPQAAKKTAKKASSAPQDAPVAPERVVAPPAPPKPQETPMNPLLGKVYALMKQNGITEAEVVKAVAMKGYFPEDMKIADYPEDFVEGVLIGAWDQIKTFIEQHVMQDIPF